MIVIFLIIGAYLLGSIPSGLIVARKVKGIDIREEGSKSIGATNVFRVVGRKWGIFVFLVDALKGYLAVKIPEIFFGETITFPALMLLGVAAIMGHSFPIWLSFRGGKGVAVSLGVFLALTLFPALVTFGIWILFFLISRIISAASLASAILFPFVLIFTYRDHESFRWLLPLSLALTFFIFFTHRANIKRLLRREEKPLF